VPVVVDLKKKKGKSGAMEIKLSENSQDKSDEEELEL
jgi:hypothetical protein